MPINVEWENRRWYEARGLAAFKVWKAKLDAVAGVQLQGNARTYLYRRVFVPVLWPHYESIDIHAALPSVAEVEATIVGLLEARPLPTWLAGPGTKIEAAYAEWLAGIPADRQPKAEAETGVQDQ